METKQVKMTCLVVGIFLGIISVATGFAAELCKLKESDVKHPYHPYGSKCQYKSTPSPVLGIIAAVSLVLARIVLPSAGDCQRYFEYSNVTSLILSMFSWTTSVIAVALFVAGATISSQWAGVLDEKSDGTFSCYVVWPGLFSGGAILSFAGVFLAIIFHYVNLSSAKRSSSEFPTASTIKINDIGKP